MIREYRESDVKRLLEIWLAASLEAHNFIEPEYWRSKLTAVEEEYLPQSETFIYQRGDKVVGFVSMTGDFIAAMFVDPAHKREGVGHLLMEHIKSGRERVELTVFEENVGAVKFYQKQGFVVIKQGIEPNSGHPELRMAYNAGVSVRR